MQTALLWAAAGTGFTFLMTTLGAASVFLFRKRNSMVFQQVFLGFAAGVMVAASVWSLLIPAIEQAEKAGQIGWIPAAGGFLLGIKAFCAAVLGGIGNLRGALLGGLLLGVMELYGQTLFGTEWRDVVAFVLLIVVLMVRPTGVLGEKMGRARA